MSQDLAGVSRVAKTRRQEKFTTLFHHLTIDLLRDSFRVLKRNAAPGIDGMTWQEYEEELEDRLADLKTGFTVERIGPNPRDESIYESRRSATTDRYLVGINSVGA